METVIHITRGATAGFAAAFIAAIYETGLSNEQNAWSTMMLILGVMLPLGTMIGLGIGAVFAAISNRLYPESLKDFFFNQNGSAVSVCILVYGFTSILGIVLLNKIIQFFASSFHHQGLAAMTMTFFLFAISIFLLVLLPFITRKTAAFVNKNKLLSFAFKRPVLFVSLIAGALSGLAIPFTIRLLSDNNISDFADFSDQSRIGSVLLSLLLIMILSATGTIALLGLRSAKIAIKLLVVLLLVSATAPLILCTATEVFSESSILFSNGKGVSSLLFQTARRF